MKFDVGDLCIMPLVKKSHVVYFKFYSSSQRSRVGGGGGGGMDPIDLAKDGDTWCVASSLKYDCGR